MATLKDQAELFPHIAVRTVNGRDESYVRGTGLAVWEIVWLSRVHHGKVAAVKEHVGAANPITPATILEALEYAEEHEDTILPLVREVEEMSPEELQEKLPRIRAFPPSADQTAPQRQ